MVEEAARKAVVTTAAVGTAGLRMARNSDAFVEAVRERTGIEVEIISGDEEARLAYLAVTSEMQLGDGSLVLFDTGGGSSQFTFGRGEQVEERFSVDVGAVRFTERFGLDGVVSKETLREALAAIAADLDRLDGRETPDVLVGIGGAVTNLAAVEHGLEHYDPSLIRGTVLDRSEVDRQIELYRTRTADERREIPACSRSAPRSSSPVPASSGPCSRSSVATRSRSATGACATGCSGSASPARARRLRDRGARPSHAG
jgi:exopolyphosphatase/guanosine-5'-triphosphate,3'-diphosphate pyrophosphatase